MSNDNVIEWGGITRLDIDPDKVLCAARAANLTEVVILGYTSDGEEYFASSRAAGSPVLWLLERSKLKLLQTVDEYEVP